MAFTENKTTLGFNIELKDGVLHKVFKKEKTDVLKDGEIIATSVEQVPAARADLETILSTEAAATVDTITTVTAEKETAEAALAPVQAELVTTKAELDAFKNPPTPEYPDLSRPAFLFMAKKLGMTEEVILGLIAAMPEGTQEEQDAKDLAELVFKNQVEFQRNNPLLNSLVDASPLTQEQVNTAWTEAVALEW